MKKVLFTIIALVVAAAITGCTHSSPKSVVKSFFSAMQKKDFNAAADCFYYEGTKSKIEQNRTACMGFMAKIWPEIDEKGGIKSIKITDVYMYEDEAEVKLTLLYGNGDMDKDTMKTIKVRGKWYLKDL